MWQQQARLLSGFRDGRPLTAHLKQGAQGRLAGGRGLCLSRWAEGPWPAAVCTVVGCHHGHQKADLKMNQRRRVLEAPQQVDVTAVPRLLGPMSPALSSQQPPEPLRGGLGTQREERCALPGRGVGGGAGGCEVTLLAWRLSFCLRVLSLRVPVSAETGEQRGTHGWLAPRLPGADAVCACSLRAPAPVDRKGGCDQSEEVTSQGGLTINPYLG